MSVASNTSSIIADTFSHCRRSKPHPILKTKQKRCYLFLAFLVKIKSENQPTKQTPPLVVIDIFRRLPLLPSFFGLYPKHSFLGSDVQAAAVKNL